MFSSKSESLYDFFNQAGVAYYIPFYQRQYSWDIENVTKLMDDLYDGVKKLCSSSDYIRFMGTVILLAEDNPQVGVHYDTNGLITKIHNVIDGQQRISTLSVVAILLSAELENIKSHITSKSWESLPSVENLLVSIDNKLFDLHEFFSNQVKKAQVEPERKPIIIRAVNSTSSPHTDQWTLKGNHNTFYRSDVAKIIAKYIYSKQIDEKINNKKLLENVKEISRWIKKTFVSQDLPDPITLVDLNTSNFRNFLDGEVDIPYLKSIDEECSDYVCGVIKILALIHFLTQRTYLTTIECPSEDLAFDMFQSLNATGTPLTAIEVFKPLVVNTLGSNYGASKTKEYFDYSDKFFDIRKSAAEKEKLTDDVLMRMSLVHDGFELGKRFSEQRDWLTRAYTSCATNVEKENLLRWLRDLSQYWEIVFLPRKPNRDSTSFNLIDHLVSIGVPSSKADLSALCIYYVKDGNHAMAHYVLSLFYSKLIRANNTDKLKAANEFVDICKAVAAFFTLWGAAATGFPDETYRELFKQDLPNISWKQGVSNQTSNFVKRHFKKSLVNKDVFSLKSKTDALNAWVKKAESSLGYGKKNLCRFALFISSNDKSPDMTPGNEGLMVAGSSGIAQYLNCTAWYSSKYEVMEHIANRDKNPQPYTYAAPDQNLYPGNYSVVDKIGNLTLWSRNANSSTYPEWPEKVYFYAAHTQITPTTPSNLSALASAQGISSVPPSLASIASNSGYVSNLAPLAYRGQKGLPWDKNIVDRRTKRIAELVFDELYDWLN